MRFKEQQDRIDRWFDRLERNSHWLLLGLIVVMWLWGPEYIELRELP